DAPVVDGARVEQVRVLPLLGIPGADVGDIRTGAHGAEHGGIVIDIIPGHVPPRAPAAPDVRTGLHLPVLVPPVAELLAAHLLAVTIHAAVLLINLTPGQCLPL